MILGSRDAIEIMVAAGFYWHGLLILTWEVVLGFGNSVFIFVHLRYAY
jgi:hypothetical protein